MIFLILSFVSKSHFHVSTFLTVKVWNAKLCYMQQRWHDRLTYEMLLFGIRVYSSHMNLAYPWYVNFLSSSSSLQSRGHYSLGFREQPYHYKDKGAYFWPSLPRHLGGKLVNWNVVSLIVQPYTIKLCVFWVQPFNPA